MYPNTAILYRQNATRGATPVGLVVILYEEMIRSLQKAITAIESGKVEERSMELTHVLGIIGYLQAVLDFENGKDVARKLAAVYNSARDRVFHANVDPRTGPVRQLIGEFSSLAEAWREVDRQIAEAPIVVSEPRMEFDPDDSLDERTEQWQG